MDYFKIDNWNPINSLNIMIEEIIKKLNTYQIEKVNNLSYSALSYNLTELAIITKLKPNFTNNIYKDLQIPYIKYLPNDDQIQPNINQTTWKPGTGYGSNVATKWDIKKYLKSDAYQLNILSKLINLILINLSESTNILNDISES